MVSLVRGVLLHAHSNGEKALSIVSLVVRHTQKETQTCLSHPQRHKQFLPSVQA